MEINVTATPRTHQNVTAEAFSTGAIERNGLVADQPIIWNRAGDYFYQYKDPTDGDSVVEFHDEALRKKLQEEEEAKAKQPPPTAPDPHPPELIPDDSTALAICLSPDVCRSPKDAVPYMCWGKGDDIFNYASDVGSNGKRIKLQNSKFSCSYGDEPGLGKGVKSNTVGDVVEPETSSSIVYVGGIPVQRHTDRCTLNNGNCPGEYSNVKSTDTHPAPDGDDKQDKAWYEKAYDWTGNKLSEAGHTVGKWVEDHPRTMGAVQVVGGVFEAVGSSALIVGGTAADATVVGAPLGVAGQAVGVAGLFNASDNVSTGLRQMWYGTPQQTAAVQAAGAASKALGATPEQTQTVQSIVSGGQVVLGGVAGAGGLVKQTGQMAARGAASEAGTIAGAEARSSASTADDAAKAEAEAIRTNSAKEAAAQGARSTKNGYLYEVDDLNRTIRARGKLTLKKAARSPKNQAAAGGVDRLSTDQGGHLIGSRFNGPSELLNTVAQNQNLNQGAWKAMENSWDRALKAGKEVIVDVQPSYAGESLRPTSFDVNYTVDGKPFSRTFQNVSGQKF